MSDTKTLLTAATRHMTPNYTPAPFVVARGEGSRLWDLEGREYLDFTGGIGVNALGHAHPAVVQAVSDQANRFLHSGNLLYHRGYIELCERLAQLSFGERVYLCNSGTEATEAALKIARRFFFDRREPRYEFVAPFGGFHGRSLAALAVTGQESYRTGFEPLLPGVRYVPFGDVEALRGVVGPHTAAVIMEPILGTSGIIVPHDGYLTAVKKVCREAGCLLIINEVQTGLGRTGKWFAYQHEDMQPDIMTLAKAVGGGLPLGAMITTEALGQTFQPGVHASTFGGNPLACAAGLATIEVIAREGLVERAAAMGKKFRQLLAQLQASCPQVREIRGRGLLMGVVMDGPVKVLQSMCRGRGLLVAASGSDVLRMFPPLTVTEAELGRCVELLSGAIDAATKLNS